MKRGISLIAVLMFMLAATTASIIVFKMLGSENFASGSRLKMSEAEAAAESGLDAVQAWLANKAPDAGVLVSNFKNGSAAINPTVPNTNIRTPIFLNNLVLGNIQNDRNPNNREQNYNVYLIGVDDTRVGDNNSIKLKFLSIGTARDRSEVRKIGYFDVEGLYKAQVPMANISAPFNEALFVREVGELPANAKISSAIINGDLTGNQPEITGNLVVTGNATFQGNNNISCGEDNQGELYVAGELNPNGDFRICGNAYIGSIDFSDNNSIFEKNLFIENGGLISNRTINVYGNLTVNKGIYNFSQDNLSEVRGDFVMLDKDARLNVTGNNNFSVRGTSWIAGNVTNSNRLILNNDAGRNLYASDTWRDADNAKNAAGYYEYNPTGADGGLVRSMGERITLPNEMPEDIGVASNLPHLKERIVLDENGDPIIEDPIQMMNIEQWITDAVSMPAKCRGVIGRDIVGLNANQTLSLNNGAPGFIDDINACYALLTETELFNGYFPIIINNDGTKSLADKTLNGKYFFIFIGSSQFTLPKTEVGSHAMLYFLDDTHGGNPNGINGPSKETEQGPILFPTGEPNYFLFSERNIRELDGANFNGSVFMANGTKIGALRNNVNINFNEDLFNSLMDAGILELTEAGRQLAGITDGDAYGQASDYRYAPLAPRLKVTSTSRYVSNEQFAIDQNYDLNPAVMVMPRIVYIPTDAPLGTDFGHELDNYFSVLYLNSAKEPAAVTANRLIAGNNWRVGRGETSNCKNLETGEILNTPTPTKGNYKCTFTATGNLQDEFFVSITGELGTASLGFSQAVYPIPEDSENNCVPVNLVHNEGLENTQCTANISISNIVGSWTVNTGDYTNENFSEFSLTADVGSGNNMSFTVCAKTEGLENLISFTVTNTVCQSLPNPQATVNFSGKLEANITRIQDPDPEKLNVPDCDLEDGFDLKEPSQSNGDTWGAFTIISSDQENIPCTVSDGGANYEYKCTPNDDNINDYQVRLAKAEALNIPEECEFLPSDPTTFQLVTRENANVPIIADIKRKGYTLNIVKPRPEVSLTFTSTEAVYFESKDAEIITEICGADCDKVTLYAGITYYINEILGTTDGSIVNIINHSGAQLLEGTILDNGRTEGTIQIPTGSYNNRAERTIEIQEITKTNELCSIRDLATVSVGSTFSNVTEIENLLLNIDRAAVFEGCFNEPKEIIYKLGDADGQNLINEWTATEDDINDYYSVYVEVICGTDLTWNSNTCNGQFMVEEQVPCEYDATIKSQCHNIAFEDIYFAPSGNWDNNNVWNNAPGYNLNTCIFIKSGNIEGNRLTKIAEADGGIYIRKDDGQGGGWWGLKNVVAGTPECSYGGSTPPSSSSSAPESSSSSSCSDGFWLDPDSGNCVAESSSSSVCEGSWVDGTCKTESSSSEGGADCDNISITVSGGGSYSGTGNEVCHLSNQTANLSMTLPAGCSVSNCSGKDNGGNNNKTCNGNGTSLSYDSQWKSFSFVINCNSCTKNYDFTIKQNQQQCP